MDHFSHEHKLRSIEVDENEDPKPYLCNICGLPILYTPSYTCSGNPQCKFFIHKACTSLPPKLTHPNHDPDPFRKHPLDLVSNGLNFTYKCSYQCSFNLHPLTAHPVEIKSKHKSHQHESHVLEVVCRETTSRCDACGSEHKGFFFCCQICSFWIHQECTLLPSFVRIGSHFDHLLFLTYSLPSNMLQGGCCLCMADLHLHHRGVYLCGECDSLAHLGCVKESMKDLGTEATLDLIQLPIEGATTSSVISKYLDNHPITKPYDHSLIILKQDKSPSPDLICDVCIQPITTSSPFYRCHLPPDDVTTFLTHRTCADHLLRIQFSFGLKPFLLQTATAAVFSSVFPCFYCRRPCNGFCYSINNLSFSYFFDLECLSAPRTLKHASHKQHALFRLDSDSNIPLSCCTGESLYLDVYTCTDCKFSIHMRCAFLPKLTRHKFDEHPLDLITDNQYKRHRFCEVCEEGIDQMHWYYGCGNCEFYFHINCIPAVGYLSRVKFGETLAVSGVHHHPVTLTRMLTNGRHERCGWCGGVIEGCVDEMAFSCCDCHFWLHFTCARDSCSSQVDTRGKITGGLSKVFEEVEDDYHTMFSKSTAECIRSLTI